MATLPGSRSRPRRRVTGAELPRRLAATLGPLLLYAMVALALWGPWVLGSPRSTLLAANDVDPSAYLWFFAWWPHALREGLDPFLTEAIFAPDGFNLAWTVSMPLPSLLLAPVTLAFGPVLTWNVIAFAAPVLGAWTAFLLCRHVSGATGPALVGGYVFGFSPYMLGALTGAPQLAFLALLPVLVLLVVRHVEGTLGDGPFVLAAALTLTAEILISTEVFATAAVFGALTLAGAYGLFPACRPRLRRTVLLLGAATGAMAVLASPLLVAVFLRERTLPDHALAAFPADLLAFVVPTGELAAAGERVGGETPRWALLGTYLGLPLLVLVAAFAVLHRSRRVALLTLGAFVVPAVAALGDTLHVAGHRTGIPLPWVAFADLPLLRYAIPLRLTAYAFLAAAVIVALWLAWRPGRARWGLALLVVASLIPAVGNRAWHTPTVDVGFFAHGGHEAVLAASDRVLTVPARGRNMFWHAQADFSFAMAAGYVGADPEAYARYPAWDMLVRAGFDPGAARPTARAEAELRRFIADKRVTAIVVEQSFAAEWRPLFDRLGVRPVAAGGVLVYRIAPQPRG